MSELTRPRFGLCGLGIHWPVSVDETLFVDRVNGREVFSGHCRCGRQWMHQSVFGIPLSKTPRRASENGPYQVEFCEDEDGSYWRVVDESGNETDVFNGTARHECQALAAALNEAYLLGRDSVLGKRA